MSPSDLLPAPDTRRLREEAIRRALLQAVDGRRNALEKGGQVRRDNNLAVFDVLLDRLLELRPDLRGQS